MSYFYEKRYRRRDGSTYVKRYSRSFNLGEGVERSDDDKHSNVAEASASRARSAVKLLAFSNPQLQGLLTLTFEGTPTEEECVRRLDQFRRKVARQVRGWQYLGVPELQKRGVLHFHLLVNFCPDMQPSPNNPRKRISGAWDWGWSDYEVIKGDDKWRTELYLLKYLGKEKTKLLSTHYVRSRGLNKIEPTYYNTREPLHPLAENVWKTHIKAKEGIEGFTITEYTYDITNIAKNRNYLYGTSNNRTKNGNGQKREPLVSGAYHRPEIQG